MTNSTVPTTAAYFPPGTITFSEHAELPSGIVDKKKAVEALWKELESEQVFLAFSLMYDQSLISLEEYNALNKLSDSIIVSFTGHSPWEEYNEFKATVLMLLLLELGETL